MHIYEALPACKGYDNGISLQSEFLHSLRKENERVSLFNSIATYRRVSDL
jgi:hypothetical protein